MQVELSERTQRALRVLQPTADDVGAAIEVLALDAIRFRLRECSGEIGALEGKHGATFEEWAARWRSNAGADRRSHQEEREYMEWEALTSEREELLTLLRELTPVNSASL